MTLLRRSFVLCLAAFITASLAFCYTTVLAAPLVLQQFEGLSDADDIAVVKAQANPPDNGLAAGPGHVVQMVNIVGRTTDKTGKIVSGPFSLKSFFDGDPDAEGSDPRILYDALSGRWFATDRKRVV